MRTLLAVAGALLVASACLGQDSDDQAKVSGEWQTGNGSGKAESWVIREKDDDVHIARSRNGEKAMEFDCNTRGRECQVEDSGKPVKVSLWFNGPVLVELETRGSEVLKRRFKPMGDGNGLELETTLISSGGRPETIRLERVQSAAQAH